MRRTAAHRAAVCLAAAVAMNAAGCGGVDVSRLEVERDTLVLIGTGYSYVPVVRKDDQGGRAHPFGAEVSPSDARLLWIRDVRVACRDTGTTRVRVSLDGDLAAFVLRCRPARRVFALPYIELDVGGPPGSLATTADFPTGPERVTPVRVDVKDPTFAIVRGDSVFPVGVGATFLSVDFGGFRQQIMVAVRRDVANESVELGAGESRSWPLASGRYVITVKVPSKHDLSFLAMETEGVACSRDGTDGDRIHCVVEERGTITLRNSINGPRRETRRAHVSIVQTL